MLDIIVIAGAAWTCGFIIALSLCYFEVIGPKHCHCKDGCSHGCKSCCCCSDTSWQSFDGKISWQ